MKEKPCNFMLKYDIKVTTNNLRKFEAFVLSETLRDV